MGRFAIHSIKLMELRNLLEKKGIYTVINHIAPKGEPYVTIWKELDFRCFEKSPDNSNASFIAYWWPITGKYSLRVYNPDYNEKLRLMYLPERGTSNLYLFKTPQAIVDTIEILFSNKEKNNMNKAIKAEEALSSLIHELTIRKIEWKSLGVIHEYPTIRIYNTGSIADIHLLATNSEYVYAIEPATPRFCEHIKSSKYRYARTSPCTNDWYIYITSRTVGCVIRDFLDTLSPNHEPKIFDKLSVKEVIFNDPATIIIWADGSKTVVKANNETFDPEKGLAMAISKKVLGNKHNYYDIFKKHVGRYEKKQKKAFGG